MNPNQIQGTLMDYMKELYNVTETFYLETRSFADKCLRIPQCYLIQNCCFDYLTTLLDKKNNQSNDMNVTYECVQYLQYNSEEINLDGMIVWKGCKNTIDSDLNDVDTSIVFDTYRNIFFIDLATAMCNNNNSMENLVTLRNLRYCSPNISDSLVQISDHSNAFKYFMNECVLLSLEDLYEMQPNINQQIFNNRLACSSVTIGDSDLQDIKSYDTVSLEILCKISQTRLVGIITNGVFKNIFCALVNHSYSLMYLFKREITFTNNNQRKIPSFAFLFNPNPNGKSSKIYTVSEAAKLKSCKTPVEIYSDVEMCEIENCLTYNQYLLPLSNNVCPSLNSLDKIIKIYISSPSDIFQQIISITKDHFNRKDEENNEFISIMNNTVTSITLTTLDSIQTVSIITNNTSINMQNQLLYLASNLSTQFSETVYFTNTLDDSFCPLRSHFDMWNITELYTNKVVNTDLIQLSSCKKNESQLQITYLCNLIVYQIITEGPRVSRFIEEQYNLGNSSFEIINSSHVVKIVCANESRIVSQNQMSSSFTEADFWFTVLLIPLSILGLLATIITYSMHSVLRTFPGLMVMAMSTSLLITYCGFLALAFSNAYGIDCFAIAMITHFALLSCIFWMTLIAMDSAKTFALQNMTVRHSNSYRRKFGLISIGVYVLVLLFWTPGVVNYGCGYTCLSWLPVNYGRVPNCWLSGQFSILFAVSGPATATSGISMILLVLSVFGIFRSVRRPEQINTANSPSKLLLIFSIKLGILTGITIGMMQISILFNWKITNFIFSAINSSIGLFVGVLFNCNLRVWRLYRKWSTKNDAVHITRTTTDT